MIYTISTDFCRKIGIVIACLYRRDISAYKCVVINPIHKHRCQFVLLQLLNCVTFFFNTKTNIPTPDAMLNFHLGKTACVTHVLSRIRCLLWSAIVAIGARVQTFQPSPVKDTFPLIRELNIKQTQGYGASHTRPISSTRLLTIIV